MPRPLRAVLSVVLFWAAIGSAQQVPQTALNQIRALLQEKAARTRVQQKIGSHLLYAQKMKHGLPIAVGIDRLEVSLQTDAADRVLVDITAAFSKDLITTIEAAGGTIVYAGRNAKSLRAWLPLDNVDTIAGRGGVTFIQPAIPGAASGSGHGLKALAQNISEGVVAHRVDQARSTYGASGAGVKIGVLSDSVEYLSDLQSSGDLATVTVIPGQSGSGFSEGTAMLEIVHDVAPDAQLYFATALNSPSNFADNIVALRNAGCDIIVDDFQYFNESPFQDGPIAQAVNTVTSGGALYLSHAGNEGSVLKNTAGVWEGDFVDSGMPIPGIGGAIHLFATGANSDAITAASNGFVALFWSDPLGGSINDYDLFLLDSNGNIVASSTSTQNGSQDPYEWFFHGTKGRKIVISKNGAAAPRFLHLFTWRGQLQYFTNGETKGHSCAVDALGVAAAAASKPPAPFNSSSPAESFTSDGPRKMFYNADGTPITPDNFLSSGGAIRNKPDITAADGVSTATPGFNPFYGTSAAAPHAAAIAALLKQVAPSATPAQIRNALTSTATDIETPGYDITTGFGTADANAALASLGVVPQPYLTLGTVMATPTIGNAVIDPGDNVNLTVSLSNGGGANATVVQGVLTSSSPDVTINNWMASFSTIPSGGAASNGTPFTFTFSSSAMCGRTIPFSLSVTFAESPTPRLFNFIVGTGAPATPITFSYTGPPAAIPDNNSAGVSVPLTVSGLSGAIKNIQFRIDGSSCSTAVGSGIDHTWVGDLVIDLISPTGTTVNLISALTNGRDNNNGHNFCNTMLDDSGSTSVQGLGPGNAPFTGTYRPAFPLSKFAGEDASGTWTLHVVDIAQGDTGSVRAWSLVITPATCCPILTVSPSTLPNAAAAIAYSQTISASGGTAPYTFSLTLGALPPGLSLSSTGVLSGTPTVTGAFSFTITAIDANGCIGSHAYSMNVTAGITFFTPDHGNTNTRVMINGLGFTGASSVTFNGSAASFTFLSDTQIRAIVPANATTGKINLTTPAGTTSSATNFTIVAQTTRTFVSTLGSDANPCYPTLPCRTFSRALDATFYGGEVIVLNSGGYGPATIDKAITIAAPDGVYAGLVASAGGNGVTISATPGDVITLKGLTLNGLAGGGANGIQVSNGSAVELSNLVINGFATGINAGGAERIHVYDSLIRGSTITGVDVSAAFVVMDQIRLEDNLQAIVARDGARVVVRRSQVFGKGSGGSGVTASSVIGSAEITLERASISNTGTALQAGASAQSIIRVSRSLITGNTVGVSTTGGGVVASLGNNTLDGNGTEGSFTLLTAK